MRTGITADWASASYKTPGFLKPIERLVDALANPARRERTALIVLAGYAAVWTLYAVIAKSSQDVQQDSAELVAWSHHLALGYSKHPPFATWLVNAWFDVFPIRDWSYYLFAVVYATLGLWICWRLFGRFLDPGKRIVAIACLTLVPYFNFHGLRFDHNAVLGALWAATALCFIRSYDTRSPLWAALAGAAAAAAMLGKYWSIFLLAGLAAAALVDRRRGIYFRSAAPWITVGVSILALSPHFVWLVQHDYSPIFYAAGVHEARTVGKSLSDTVGYLGGAAGYAAAPVLIVLALARPGRAAFADMLMPDTAERRFAAVAFWTMLLLPVVVGLVFGFELNSIWTMVGFILLPVVLLSSPLVILGRRAVTLIVAFAVVLPLVMLALSPAIAYALHFGRVSQSAANGQLLAERIEQEWRRTTDRPLRIVGGAYDLANVTAFYMPQQPDALPLTEPATAPWVTPERIAREGIVLICELRIGGKGHYYCGRKLARAINQIAAKNPNGRRIEVTITRSYFDVPGKPGHYRIVIVPPRAAQ